MSRPRLSLTNYDVLRELCEACRAEKFHFVPIGAAPAPGTCLKCGSAGQLVDLSDTALMRLVTTSTGQIIVVPVVRSA